MSLPDGGPAFPQTPASWYRQGSLEEQSAPVPSGLSLRDWFAGMALQVIKLKANEEKFSESDVAPFAAQVALLAYAIADALLKQREETP